MTHKELVERDLFATAKAYRDSGVLRPWHQFWNGNKAAVDRLHLGPAERRQLHDRLMDIVMGVPIKEEKNALHQPQGR